jgi:hypothetical protein
MGQENAEKMTVTGPIFDLYAAALMCTKIKGTPSAPTRA